MGVPAVMRLPSIRPALLAPALAAVLAAGAVAATAVLLGRAESARSHQVALISTLSTLNEVETLPWALDPAVGGSAVIEARLAADEARLSASLARLGLQGDDAVLERNFASLSRIAAFVRSRRTSTMQALRLAADEERTLVPVTRAIDAGAASSGHSARAYERYALGESSVAIALLLAGFGVAYGRALRVAGRQRKAREAAEEAHRDLGIALEKLERAQQERMFLLRRTVQGAEDERRRIAADLHDGPIQRLTAAVFSLDLLGNRLGRGDDVSEVLAQIRAQLGDEMQSLRQLMSELRPPVLDERGIASAIGAAAADILPAGTECLLHDAIGASRFDPEIESAAHRSVREALVNVSKHAQAAHVDIDLRREGDRLGLVVSDDGIGFDATGAAESPLGEHLGLLAVRERLESIGGELRVSSRPGGGTRFEAFLPWTPPGTEAERAVA